MSNRYKVVEKHKKDSEITPNYDLKSTEARKYIVGGAAVFIPDLCEMLKKDWYPRLPYEEITATPYLRNEIKHKVLEDWLATEDREGWPRCIIIRFWPDWMAQPNEESGVTAAEKQTYQSYRDFMRLMIGHKNRCRSYTNYIPDVPVEPQEEEPIGEKHRESPRNPQEVYEHSMNALGDIWDWLFNYKAAPGPDTDTESKIIAPSEKYHLRLLKGIESKDRAILINQVSHMNTACIGFLKRARDILAQETRVDK